MSELGLAWMWCAVQVTVLSIASILVYFAVRRCGPAAGSLVTSTTLLLTSCLTVLVFCPWPTWTARLIAISERAVQPSPALQVETQQANAPVLNATADQSQPVGEPMAIGAGTQWDWFSTAFVDEFKRVARGDAPPPQQHWWAAGGSFFLLLALGGLLRIALSFRAVHKVRQRTVPLRDADLNQLVEDLTLQLGGRRPVIELRESSELSSAATFGWLRPIVLMPIEWREWSPETLRAVLAHELAHVVRRDYLIWLLAQVGVALHAYHPLVHWLAGRLRQDQECAADVTACQVVGGPQAYLTVLATMAIHQDDRRLGWSTHPFLPSRRTFLRRIEMLRDLKRVPLPPSWRARSMTVAALLVLAIAASGLRAMQSGAIALAQQPKPQLSSQGAKQAAINFGYVPRDAVLVFALRPAQLLQNKEVAKQAAAFEEVQKSLAEQVGINLAEVEQLLVVAMMHEDPQHGPDEPCFIVRLTKPVDEETITKIVGPNGKKSEYDGHVVYSVPNQFCAIADDHTFIATRNEGLLRRLIVAGPDAAPATSVASTWSALADVDAGAFVNSAQLRAALDLQLNQGKPLSNPLMGLAPIWQKASALAAGVRVGDKVELQLIATCDKAEDVKSVQDTLSAALTLGRGLLTQLRAQASRQPGDQGAAALKTIDLAEDFLDETKVTSEGNTVRAHASMEGSKVTQLVTALAKATNAAQGAAGRTRSTNNLKQLALAMHNYHDTHNRFPAASILGPDGKTPHSWRVELLPYLEQEALFRQYKMDEPWDSPNNLKILEQMPALFRDPSEPRESKNASYFVVVGKGTIFGDKEGNRFQNITDGTSNTLMIVEAKRDIPWTKPEDIEWDSAQQPPELGGHYPEGFLAALGDGSVRFISKAVDPKILKLLLIKDDGQVIPNIP